MKSSDPSLYFKLKFKLSLHAKLGFLLTVARHQFPGHGSPRSMEVAVRVVLLLAVVSATLCTTACAKSGSAHDNVDDPQEAGSVHAELEEMP